MPPTKYSALTSPRPERAESVRCCAVGKPLHRQRPSFPNRLHRFSAAVNPPHACAPRPLTYPPKPTPPNPVPNTIGTQPILFGTRFAEQSCWSCPASRRILRLHLRHPAASPLTLRTCPQASAGSWQDGFLGRSAPEAMCRFGASVVLASAGQTTGSYHLHATAWRTKDRPACGKTFD